MKDEEAGVGGSGEHEKRQLLKEVCMRQEKCVFCSNSWASEYVTSATVKTVARE